MFVQFLLKEEVSRGFEPATCVLAILGAIAHKFHTSFHTNESATHVGSFRRKNSTSELRMQPDLVFLLWSGSEQTNKLSIKKRMIFFKFFKQNRASDKEHSDSWNFLTTIMFL